MAMRSFYVQPHIPETLKNLYELAYNIWSTWDHDAFKLFSRIDPGLYRQVNHNPVKLLHLLGSKKLAELAKDPGFLFELDGVYQSFLTYQSFEGKYTDKKGKERPFGADDIIAYLSMEFSLHESIPIYSGGLGILAGDYLKAASDVGLSLIGFGLLYRFGYFSQRINPNGYQEEDFKENIWSLKPVREVKDKEGKPLIIEVPLKGEKVLAKIWKVRVGRTDLYLLDCNLEGNKPVHRAITDMLYDPERDDRIVQELVLGRGTRIALKALGIQPKVYHLNEGHSAFLVVERLRELMLTHQLSFEEASAVIRHSTVFTTHTPVIEGNEHFDQDMVAQYLKPDLAELGIGVEEFLSLGRVKDGERTFWLPALAIRFSRHSNGVSRLHAEVSREMWQPLFKEYHPREIPIYSVTNGVHLQTWMSAELAQLFDRYIGPDYLHNAESPEVWEGVYHIPDDELWDAHMRAKRATIAFIRRRLTAELERKGFARTRIRDIQTILDPRALSIGFARRFAPYKRADLILQDPDRLSALLTNPDRPIQLIFSGKSHPADVEGKKIIKRLLDFISEKQLEQRIVFVEDYDFDVGRHLVCGVDVWLNTPLRPMEASGTSGMKAGINGVLNLSIMDGWWPEGYSGTNGWAITAGESHNDLETKRQVEAAQIYDLLENQICPLYYNRSQGHTPREWVAWMKNSISTIGQGFNMHRMLREYLNLFYLPQMSLRADLLGDKCALACKLSEMKKTIDAAWSGIRIKDYFPFTEKEAPTADQELTIDCYVELGGADPALFQAEAVHHYGYKQDRLEVTPLAFAEKYEDGVAKYTGAIRLSEPGTQELGVRVVPADRLFRETYPNYLKWGG